MHHQPHWHRSGAAHQALQLGDLPAGCLRVARAEHQQQHLLQAPGFGHGLHRRALRRDPLAELGQIVVGLLLPGVGWIATGEVGGGGPVAAGLGMLSEAQPQLGIEIEPHHRFTAMGLQLLGAAHAGDQA